MLRHCGLDQLGLGLRHPFGYPRNELGIELIVRGARLDEDGFGSVGDAKITKDGITLFEPDSDYLLQGFDFGNHRRRIRWGRRGYR